MLAYITTHGLNVLDKKAIIPRSFLTILIISKINRHEYHEKKQFRILFVIKYFNILAAKLKNYSPQVLVP